jgi:hypothetical protein
LAQGLMLPFLGLAALRFGIKPSFNQLEAAPLWLSECLESCPAWPD